MTDGTTVEHHRSVEYVVRDHQLQTDGFTVRRSDDGRRIDVEGICPGCGGSTATTWEFGTGNGYKGIRRRSTMELAGARTVCCDCGYAHSNRPDDAIFLGCGAYWQVDLP